MAISTDQHTISQDWPTENVLINQQAISQDWPRKKVLIDIQEILEDWPSKERFKRREILKWRNISDDVVYKIKKVSHRESKYGLSAILTLKQNGEMSFLYGLLNVLLKILKMNLINLFI